MVKFLPFVLIPIVILVGLGYWRFAVARPETTIPQVVQSQTPMEVPKTLPASTLEDRVQSLEDAISKFSTSTASPQPQPNSSPATNVNSLVSRLNTAESAITELKARVSALEKGTTTTTQTSSKYPLYIPLGSGGGPWGDQTWNTLAEYQVTINPDNYPGYTSIQLEANFRLSEAAGTGSVRLYNVTGSSAVSSSQLDTTSTAFGTQTSGTFTLPAGQKTYTIQIQTTAGKTLFVQSARIKVNF